MIQKTHREFDRLEAAVILEVFDILSKQIRINDLISVRFSDHLKFLESPFNHAHRLSDGFLAMRQIASSYGLLIDDFVQKALSATFPNKFSNSELDNIKHPFFPEPLCFNLILSSMKRSGYFCFPSPLNESTLRNLQSVETCLALDVREGRCDADILETSTNPDLLRFVLDPVFLTIAGSYLGVLPILDSIIVGKSRVSSHLRSEDLDKNAMVWHFDKDRTNFVKFFVYLNDVDSSNGPHQYVEDTRSKLHIIPRNGTRYDSGAIYSSFELPRIQTILGRAGTVFVGDTHTIHRGLPLLERERSLLQFQFSSSLYGDPFEHFPYTSIKDSGLEEFSRCFPRVFQRFRI